MLQTLERSVRMIQYAKTFSLSFWKRKLILTSLMNLLLTRVVSRGWRLKPKKTFTSQNKTTSEKITKKFETPPHKNPRFAPGTNQLHHQDSSTLKLFITNLQPNIFINIFYLNPPHSSTFPISYRM